METTTIKLDKRTKYALDKYKQISESYANTINRLLEVERKKRL